MALWTGTTNPSSTRELCGKSLPWVPKSNCSACISVLSVNRLGHDLLDIESACLVLAEVCKLGNNAPTLTRQVCNLHTDMGNR